MIDPTHDLSLVRQAQVLAISRASTYYTPPPTSEADLALVRIIDRLHLEHPFMGARMLRDQLNRRGFMIGRKHVANLMRTLGIEALSRGAASLTLVDNGTVARGLIARNVALLKAEALHLKVDATRLVANNAEANAEIFMVPP